MSDAALPPASTAATPPPAPQRVRRWPTAVVTFLLTSVAAFAVGRYVVLNVLPKQEWWLRQDPKAFDDDPRAQGEYLERVLYSELSDESKLNLLFEVLGNPYSFDDHSPYPTDEANDNSYTLRDAAWKLERGAQKEQNGVGNRYPYLWEPFLKLHVAVLKNPAASMDAHRKALFLLNVAVELARHLYSLDGHEKTGVPARFWLGKETGTTLSDSRWAIQESTPHLVPFLTSPDVHLRRMSTRAFAVIGWPRPPRQAESVVTQVFPTAKLIAGLTDVDPRVRRNAALALAHLPEKDMPDAFPALLSRFTDEPDVAAKCEVIQTLGQLDTTKDHDPRPAFADFLLAQHPETEHQAVSGYVYLALARLGATTETVRAAVARLNRMKPSENGMVVFAAAVFLGESPSSQAAGEALLTRIRADWTEHRNGIWISGGHDSRLFTFTYALLKQREVARTAVSDLIRLIPAIHHGRYTFSVQTKIPPIRRHQQFPPRPPDLWGDAEPIPEGWLSAEVERLGPPAKSDLPALRALLDYDGEHITKPMVFQEPPECIALVRQEAAKALLRDAVAGAKDRRAALEAVRDDPASHPALVTQAKVELKKLVGE